MKELEHRLLQRAANAQTIVHALRGGYALCGFSDSVPGDWPSGHLWVGPTLTRDVTCNLCRATLEHEEHEKETRKPT